MALNFGSPSSAPATGLGAGFSFGNKPAFGAGSTPSTGFGLGSTPSTGFGLGSTPSTGFGLGSTPLTGFGLGSTPATGFGLGSTPSTGFGLGAPAAAAAPAFGVASSTAAGLNFGPLTAATTATGFGLGSTLTSNAPTGLSFGTSNTGLGSGGGFMINPTSTAAATSTAQGFGLGTSFLGAAPATSATPLFGLKTATTTTAAPPGLTGPPFVGLGGVESSGSSTLPGLGASWAGGGTATTNATGTGANEQPRHQKLSNELLQTVDFFKTFVKQQKSLSSDVARASIKPLQKAEASLDALSASVLSCAANVRTSRAAARRLREACARAAASAEEAAASGSHETSHPSAPDLLLSLVAEHEAIVRRFAVQVDAADRQMQGGSRTLTEQDLTLGMTRMHEMLIALAGRLAALGARVNELKQFYMNLRKHHLHLSDDVFQQNSPKGGRDKSMLTNVLNQVDDGKQYLSTSSTFQPNSVVIADPRLALGLPTYQKVSIVGPPPFTYLGPPGFGGYPFGYNSPSTENKTQINAPTPGNFGSPWSTTQQSSLGLLGASVNPLNTSLPTENTSAFQLQKPPTGYKRGKH